MRNRNIIISSTDRHRLLQLIDSARLDRRIPSQSLDVLEGELARATIVEPEELPRDVVAMNSTIWFRDLDSEEIERYTLVFPPAPMWFTVGSRCWPPSVPRCSAIASATSSNGASPRVAADWKSPRWISTRQLMSPNQLPYWRNVRSPI